jgi:plastocyanin
VAGRRARRALLGAVLALAAPAGAADLVVSVRDAGGGPVADAVVYAVAVDGDGRPLPAPEPTEIEQVDKEYVPYVTAVRAGTRVAFPNHDPVRHHVYSFSEAKTFEIPLYKGTPPEPILFDRPGVVTLGCNIHDWMKAYVFVTDTPHFGVTDGSGAVTLPALPDGRFAVEVWHPRQQGEPGATRQAVALDGADRSLGFTIERKRVWRPRRAPSSAGGAVYR